MKWPDIYLLCFAVGALWSLATLLLGSFHLGHSGSAHLGHGHSHVAHGHAHAGKAFTHDISWLGSLINPTCAAAFLTWFGGIGYLLTRHSGLGFWIDLALAIAVGLCGAWLLAAFLCFLESREQPLNPADYEMTGVFGHVSSAIRPDGVGEVIYLRDGARKLVPARSDDAIKIERGSEVIVTRYEKGIAYVRTWDAMTQSARLRRPDALQKETEHVE